MVKHELERVASGVSTQAAKGLPRSLPQAWPYVSTSLHALWLPANDPVWDVPSIYSRERIGDLPVPYYRLTAGIWGWIHSRLAAIDANEATRPVGQDLATVLERLAVIDDFASRNFTAKELADAIRVPMRKLPVVRIPAPWLGDEKVDPKRVVGGVKKA